MFESGLRLSLWVSEAMTSFVSSCGDFWGATLVMRFAALIVFCCCSAMVSCSCTA